MASHAYSSRSAPEQWHNGLPWAAAAYLRKSITTIEKVVCSSLRTRQCRNNLYSGVAQCNRDQPSIHCLTVNNWLIDHCLSAKQGLHSGYMHEARTGISNVLVRLNARLHYSLTCAICSLPWHVCKVVDVDQRPSG